MARSERSAQLNFYMPAFVMSAWGVTLLHAVVSGRLVTLLHPVFRPLVLAAGIFLLVLSVVHLCFFRPASMVTACDGLWPALSTIVLGLLLTVPLLAAAAYAPMGFSENALEARGLDANLSAPTSENDDDAKRLLAGIAKLKPGEALAIDLPDLATAATAPKLVQGLEGHSVRVSGQFHPVDANEFKIFRLLMFCCAADAVPLGVTVKGAPGEFKKTDWVEVEGPVHFVIEKEKDSVLPQIELHAMKRIDAPADPYVY